MKDLELLVTLCPTFLHYRRFATDKRLAAIRLNSAMVFGTEVDAELQAAKAVPDAIPLYFDIKGRQLRIREVIPNNANLEIRLNHPIEVETPTMVLFKAGADRALLEQVKGDHLIFRGGPQFRVKEGESICVRHPSLNIQGPIYCDYEIEKITKVVRAGFRRFFLSYVESWRDVDEFCDLIGDRYDEIFLKIESKPGLNFVAQKFKKIDGISLCAARGDMYVELDKPHEILNACKLIARKDPEALAGSRLLLSLVNSPIPIKMSSERSKIIKQRLETFKKKDNLAPDEAGRLIEDGELMLNIINEQRDGDRSSAVPECHDFSDLAWLYDIGYRRMMICDEICLKETLLSRAVNVFQSFRDSYAEEKITDDDDPPVKCGFLGKWFPRVFG